jgi:hypothetical protein
MWPSSGAEISAYSRRIAAQMVAASAFTLATSARAPGG